MSADDMFALNAGAKVSTYAVGRERQPVLVVDDLLADSRPLIELIAETVAFRPEPEAGNFYPGLRAPAPAGYVQCLSRALGPLVAQAFADLAGRRAKTSASVSIATRRPEDLVLAQRLPHFDAVNGGQIAVLHYLCDASHGGTAFYRHRSTGFETITAERARPYVAALEREIEASPPPQAYVAGDTPLFEQIGAVEAQMNRVVVYRSGLLHAGTIAPGATLSADPRRGRLTANSFLLF